MNKRKPNALKVRFDNDMYDKIVDIANKNDTSLSEVIRYLINEGLQQYDKH